MAESRIPSNLPGSEKKEGFVSGKGAMAGKPVKAKTRFIDIFLPEDCPDIGHYLWWKIFVPAASAMAFEMFNNFFSSSKKAFNDFLFKNHDVTMSNMSSGGSSTADNRPSYMRYYDSQSTAAIKTHTANAQNNVSKGAYTFTGIEFVTATAAREVLAMMMEEIAHHNMVSVLQMYDFAELPQLAKSTDDDWGWYTLNGTDVRPLGNGKWYIDFPGVVSLKSRN